jgi:hypothetical protein
LQDLPPCGWASVEPQEDGEDEEAESGGLEWKMKKIFSCVWGMKVIEVIDDHQGEWGSRFGRWNY